MVLAAMMLLAAPAGAELSKEWRWCTGKDNASIDLVIRSCTSVIRSGREPAEHLATAFYNRATAHRIQGWYDRAIQDYDEAIRLDPEYALAYNDRGTAYSRKAQPRRAIQDYDKAIRLDPGMTFAYSNRGNAHSSRGELDQIGRAHV